LNVPRTAREQFQLSQRINKADLQEGDLVFFNTTGGISHVGVYLANNYFVHSSSSQGVMVSYLDDPYFNKKYLGSGRLSAK
jgi:lipoprotein Spr